MQRFWLGTWNVDAQPAPAGPAATPIAASGARRLALEVLEQDGRFLVLLSAADRLADTGTLQCLIGFANGAQECSLWRSRGFPVGEAAIRQHDGWLKLFSPFFPEGESSMRYGELLLAIRGVQTPGLEGPGLSLTAGYEQFQEAPQPGKPASFVLRKGVHWDIARSGVLALGPQALEIRAPRTRSPSLAPLSDGPVAISHAWSGECPGPPQATFSPQPPARVRRADAFGVPAFAFRDVEVLGFRIELGRDDAEGLLAPLNFRPPGEPSSGFRFHAATGAIQLQLLRYGSMRLAGEPLPPLGATDFQSQHELVVQVSTGRMDDGETQLHHPALHAPAIFVDNPWSKVLGRDLQGFDKCLADFCVRDEATQSFLRLRPDGIRPVDGKRSKLRDVVRINLVDVVSNEASPPNPALLEIEFDELDPALKRLRAHPGWCRGDFDTRIVMPDFAKRALSTDEFRSIQATPVDQRRLEKAWISATCALSDRTGDEMPSAIAHMTFHALDAAPVGWRKLCELLGAKPGGTAEHSFEPGDWVRSKFSMKLTVDDE